MEVNQKDFFLEAKKIGIGLDQANQLWKSLEEKREQNFSFVSVAYYLGALIVVAAMSVFATNAWLELSKISFLILSLSYTAIFAVIGNALYGKSRTRIPGGLFILLSVCMIPWVIYCFQDWMGWRHNSEWGHYRNFSEYIRGDWFLIELGTIIAAILALYRYRLPFLLAPLCFALWFMSMDSMSLFFWGGGASFLKRMVVTVVWVGIDRGRLYH